MKRRIRRRRDAGFTLLELLLSLALLALLMGSLLSGMQLAQKAFETSRSNQAVGDLEAAATALSDMLSHAYPMMIPDQKKGQTLFFFGRPDGCMFVGLSEGQTQAGGFFAGEIGLEPNGSSADLAVWTQSFRPAEASQIARSSMQKTEAVRGVSFLQLRYFGVMEEGKPPRWSDNWLDAAHLPKLIAVRFTTARFGRPVEIDFTVALRQEAQ
ncbi:prepilin-type N-terminal cleavage/methylation domain-containing protein [Methylocystis heyeri]|uniref:Prepilin-type N-terminal cleavage/methylation domain-containing protein n=1 Tax=Methylocystis heyeri TaxID=391905 RepID=A0A6B8KI73_9HYPH|nr:prepilin-type N-terminal cleavage/methylation domain-containing protein [Methylocystis heyeri]QGM46213.1 prepilin-type N-terminal cleavage/methylation domain-containing protein [Methylocystis heyeri]